MGMYKRIPENTFKQLQMDAGVICSSFNPETGVVVASDIIGATTGGVQIDATPSYSDLGEDVDNCPNNMLELKKLESWECKISGTYLTTSASMMKNLLGSAEIDGSHISLKDKLSKEDFQTLWFVGDYGDNGFLAVKLSNALNTSGLSLKTEKGNKGQISFEYLGHYSMENQTKVPLDIYIKDEVTMFNVNYTLENVSKVIGAEEVAQNGDLLAQFKANSSYSLPASISVKIGGEEAKISDYDWNNSSGVLYVKSSATTGNIEVSVIA